MADLYTSNTTIMTDASKPAVDKSALYSLISSRPLALLAVAFGLIIVTTRLFSSRPPIPRQNGDKAGQTVPTVPYWLPLLGHIPNMAWDATGFTRHMRSIYTNGAFSIVLGGTVHNILYTPGLVTTLMNSRDSNVAHEDMSIALLERVFGFPMKTEKGVYKAAFPELMACYRFLLGEPGLGEMIERTAGNVKETISNFVSFSSSLVDQAYWERTSRAAVAKNKSGEDVVEADLLNLVRDYCAAAANPSVIGSNFLANYPDFFADIWTFDRAFLLIAAGLPRWVPIPPVTRGHIARQRALRSLVAFHEAMETRAAGEDPGADWRDLDDVGPLVQKRVEAYRKHGMSMEGRAALELALLWATNANSNMLVFWMLIRIYCDEDLLASVREEFAPYVRAVQRKQEFPLPEPPYLEKLDVDGLCSGCPLLKSCYIECLRLDAASWSLKVVQNDFVISGRERDSQAFFLRKGEFVHAAHDLHNTNPKYFPEPDEWRADRHIKSDAGKTRTADMGNIRPYGKLTSQVLRPLTTVRLWRWSGGGSGMCKGRAFAYKECMVFAASIVALWDIEPAGGGEWKIPAHRKATGVYGTNDLTRVWLKRRVLPIV